MNRNKYLSRNKKSAVFIASIFATLTFSKMAVAGPASDVLTKCLIASTTADDKSAVVRWVFGTLALHPDAAPLSTVTDAQRADFNAKTARLFERLVTENCKAQTQAAVRAEGITAIQTSFRSFGEIATRELLSNPKVSQGLSNTASNLDPMKLLDIMN
ncbi:MAG: hypothetical protein JWM78_3118 [Verrucomicrobiaceae bacterium]|nr:hypothetical protein [Verrucomicrobiaceae bacterium]